MPCLTYQSALKMHAGCDYNTPGLPKPLKASLFNDFMMILWFFYEHFGKSKFQKNFFTFLKYEDGQGEAYYTGPGLSNPIFDLVFAILFFYIYIYFFRYYFFKYYFYSVTYCTKF